MQEVRLPTELRNGTWRELEHSGYDRLVALDEGLRAVAREMLLPANQAPEHLGISRESQICSA